MSERFFSSELVTTDEATLVDHEAHHLLHVMRLKAGAQVVLFDGSGWEFDAEVRRCGRRDVQLVVLSRREVDRELPAALTIAAALPKGDRQRWMVEKLTELGVTRLAPIETERSVAAVSSSGLTKLRRAVIEASKQCRRNRLMKISEPISLDVFLREEPQATRRLIAHPTGSPVGALSGGVAQPTTIAIGPEGGFTDDEVRRALGAGWTTLAMGSRILRTETAAVAAAALVANATAG